MIDPTYRRTSGRTPPENLPGPSRCRAIAAFCGALALLILLPATLRAAPACGLRADGDLQTEIRSVVRGLTEPGAAEQHQAAVENATDLGQRPGTDRVHLLEQVAVFLSGAGGTEEAMGGALLFHILDFQREEILAATLPHLVAAAPGLNKVLRDLAATTVAAAPGTGDPVSTILEIEAWRAPSAGTPGAPGRRAEIGRMLGDLAANQNPSVRAYARAVVTDDPELVGPEVRKRLRQE